MGAKSGSREGGEHVRALRRTCHPRERRDGSPGQGWPEFRLQGTGTNGGPTEGLLIDKARLGGYAAGKKAGTPRDRNRAARNENP
jgi:hypothetical protein